MEKCFQCGGLERERGAVKNGSVKSKTAISVLFMEY